jgi:hypothetical protein
MNEIAPSCLSPQPEAIEVPARFLERPGILIDSQQKVSGIGFECESDSSGTGSTAQINEVSSRQSCQTKTACDMFCLKKMQRRVEKCERRSFTGAVERPAYARFRPPLDVQAGERLEGATNFLKSQSLKMPLLEFLIPGAESERHGAILA